MTSNEFIKENSKKQIDLLSSRSPRDFNIFKCSKKLHQSLYWHVLGSSNPASVLRSAYMFIALLSARYDNSVKAGQKLHPRETRPLSVLEDFGLRRVVIT